MVELSGVTQWVISMVVNPLMWLVLIIGFVLGIFIILKIRKRRALKYPAIEIVDLGNGNMGLNKLRCGWFGKQMYLKGLWWRGREVMRTNTGEEILNFSEEDFQEVDSQRGVVFYRDPISRSLIPIDRLKIIGKEMVANIPPAEYVDTAIDIVRDAERETSDWREKVIMWAIFGGLIIFALVSIIVIIQMIKNSQSEASKLVLEAGKTCLESARSVCSQITSGGIGTATNAP